MPIIKIDLGKWNKVINKKISKITRLVKQLDKIIRTEGRGKERGLVNRIRIENRANKNRHFIRILPKLWTYEIIISKFQ